LSLRGENGGCVILLNLWAYSCELCLISHNGRLVDYIEIIVSLGWFFMLKWVSNQATIMPKSSIWVWASTWVVYVWTCVCKWMVSVSMYMIVYIYIGMETIRRGRACHWINGDQITLSTMTIVWSKSNFVYVCM